jgi:uncharacterized protein
VTTLDNFRREARRWLKAVRNGDAGARERLRRAHPHAPDPPTLRDIQHAVAREHGYESWRAMRTVLDQRTTPDTLTSDLEPGARMAAFLEAACPDATVSGPFNRSLHLNTAMRLLARHPEVARENLYTSVACGDLVEVERILDTRPRAASEAGGPRGWPPLLYLCNARLSIAAAHENAVAIARALLDRGADPNTRYILKGIEDYPYTALTGVLGRGEEEAQTHPRAEALARLLFERGAEPYDTQLLYNVFADHGSRPLLDDDIVWLMDLIYAHALQRGRGADWSNPDWPMLDPWGRGCGAGFLLEAAIDRNLLKLGEWLLAHGAGPNASRGPSDVATATPYEQAVRRGFAEMADLLIRSGAAPVAVNADGQPPEDAFVAACLRVDRNKVRALLAEHPEYLQSPKAMFAATRDDRADVVELLLDLGVSPNVEDQSRTRPLHQAAGTDAAQTIALLIDRGAEVDARESNWNATPLGFAVYGQRHRAIAVLGRVSRDVFNLTFTGNVDRLRELLDAEPDLANAVNSNGATPLMRLPDDEGRALAIVDLFLAHDADVSARDKDGKTAADIAFERGLDAIAERLLRQA